MKTFDQNCNWIKGTKFELAFRVEFQYLSQRQLRQFLFEYCRIYHEVYSFEILDAAFAYLEYQQQNNSKELLDKLSKVKKDVEYGMAEYCFSLNEISQALYRLLNPAEMKYECVVETLNHVWEAYSCNENAEEFIDREDERLCNLLKQTRGNVC